MNQTTKAMRMAVFTAVVALVTGGLNPAAATAAPPTDPSPAPTASCSYVLTPPTKVTVSGTDMVTATMTHGPCTGVITPNSMLVCVELQGYTPPQCNFHPNFDPIQVYFTPYRSGGTYTSTGRGCGNVAPYADEACFLKGPLTNSL